MVNTALTIRCGLHGREAPGRFGWNFVDRKCAKTVFVTEIIGMRVLGCLFFQISPPLHPRVAVCFNGHR